MALPQWFYSPTGVIRLEGFPEIHRWYDDFSESMEGEEKLIVTQKDMLLKGERDAAYMEWLRRFRDNHGVRVKNMKWQSIRITGKDYPFARKEDWWLPYMDCTFKVFMQPHTAKCPVTKDWIQYYILSPEDTYLVHCYNRHIKGIAYPHRNTFKWITPHPPLRNLLMVPTECAPHLRHETTAGALPEGL